MALSKQALKRAIDSVPEGHEVGVWVVRVCRAVESDVRKDDEALIRQMLESMCWAARVMTISEDEAPGYFAALIAGRARLEHPCA